MLRKWLRSRCVLFGALVFGFWICGCGPHGAGPTGKAHIDPLVLSLKQNTSHPGGLWCTIELFNNGDTPIKFDPEFSVLTHWHLEDEMGDSLFKDSGQSTYGYRELSRTSIPRRLVEVRPGDRLQLDVDLANGVRIVVHMRLMSLDDAGQRRESDSNYEIIKRPLLPTCGNKIFIWAEYDGANAQAQSNVKAVCRASVTELGLPIIHLRSEKLELVVPP
jgi:hypothetical protein